MGSENRAIVFYDGECGFCSWIISFIIKAEKDESLHFAALQSSFATQFLSSYTIKTVGYKTFYFYDSKKLYSKSSGVFRLLKFLKWPYRLLYIFWPIPLFMRDYFYDLIAKRRNRLMQGHCILLTAQQKKRFIK